MSVQRGQQRQAETVISDLEAVSASFQNEADIAGKTAQEAIAEVIDLNKLLQSSFSPSFAPATVAAWAAAAKSNNPESSHNAAG